MPPKHPKRLDGKPVGMDLQSAVETTDGGAIAEFQATYG